MSGTPVLMLMGSDSDRPVVAKGTEVLKELGVGYKLVVASAHRTPEKVKDLVQGASGAGHKVVIAAAGLAAHLPGAVAAWTTLPVIGIPIGAGPLSGVDALYSIVQMPPGMPVATVGVDNARNAAVLAAQILALGDPELGQRLVEFRRRQAQKVEEAQVEQWTP